MATLGRDKPPPRMKGASSSGMCPLMKALASAEAARRLYGGEWVISAWAWNEFRMQRATRDGETTMTTDEQITLRGAGRQLNSIIERLNAIDTKIAIISSMIASLDKSFTDMSERILPPMPPVRNRRHRL